MMMTLRSTLRTVQWVGCEPLLASYAVVKSLQSIAEEESHGETLLGRSANATCEICNAMPTLHTSSYKSNAMQEPNRTDQYR